MILVHLDTNDSILLLCNDKSFHALYYIIKQMDLDTNIWYADKINKTTIANKLEISLASLEKMIASLKRNNLIRPTSRGIYQLTKLLKDY
jgi:predicted transcriptional regulator